LPVYPKDQTEPRKSGRPFLRTPAAAAYLNVGQSTLEKLRCFGGGPQYSKLGPKLIIYDPDVLDAYAADRARQSTSQENPDPEARRAEAQIRRGRLPKPRRLAELAGGDGHAD
jgi:hypothetical protein